MEKAFASLFDDFVAESLPLAERVSARCLDLERAFAAGSQDSSAIQQIKSDLHTLKGSAAMMGLGPLTAVAHALEDVCDLAAQGSARDARVTDLLLEGGDLLQAMVRAGPEEGIHERAANELIARVTVFVQSLRAGEAPAREARSADPAPVDPGSFAVAGASASGDSLRVPLQRLDRMLEWVGEAAILQASLEQVSASLIRGVGYTADTDRLDRTTVALKKILKQIQVALMDARLVPVSTLFERFRRYARDLARERGQPIRLATAGGETMLDKAIVDRLVEPILHLVRNAAAHGIEPEAARRIAGKSAEGTISLSARHLAGEVVVSVADDGRGLDLDAVVARAREMGYETDRISPDEALRLIFAPGLSTSAEVSELSGRGVGLDIVASAVGALGARIDVESTPGQGATFHLILPLTLTTSKGLLVEIGGEAYAIQASHVLECTHVAPGALHEVYRLGVMAWRGNVIHASDGGEIVGLGRRGAERPFCVVLAAGARVRGLLVDRLLGYQEIVIKPLDPALGQPEGIAGATLLADGRVVLILDAGWVVARRAADPDSSRDRGGSPDLGARAGGRI